MKRQHTSNKHCQFTVISRAVVETDSSKTKTETAKFFRDQDRSRSQLWLRDQDRDRDQKNDVINSFFDFLKISF